MLCISMCEHLCISVYVGGVVCTLMGLSLLAMRMCVNVHVCALMCACVDVCIGVLICTSTSVDRYRCMYLRTLVHVHLYPHISTCVHVPGVFRKSGPPMLAQTAKPGGLATGPCAVHICEEVVHGLPLPGVPALALRPGFQECGPRLRARRPGERCGSQRRAKLYRGGIRKMGRLGHTEIGWSRASVQLTPLRPKAGLGSAKTGSTKIWAYLDQIGGGMLVLALRAPRNQIPQHCCFVHWAVWTLLEVSCVRTCLAHPGCTSATRLFA